MTGAERAARLQLARSRNLGARAWRDLMGRFGSARKALEALPKLTRRGGNRRYAVQTREAAEREMEDGARAGAALILPGEAEYPPLLAAIDDPPPALRAKGDAAAPADFSLALLELEPSGKIRISPEGVALA